MGSSDTAEEGVELKEENVAEVGKDTVDSLALVFEKQQNATESDAEARIE